MIREWTTLQKSQRSLLAKKRGYGKWMVGKKHSRETKAKMSKARKGKPFSGTPSDWKGKKHTLESRYKMAFSAQGRYVSIETRRKLSEARKGSRNHNWKGGITCYQDSIRHSLEYIIWRSIILRRDDYTCQTCGTRGGKLHVDHELPFASHPALRLEILNGRVLRIPCHRKRHQQEKLTNPRIEITIL